LVRRGIFLYPVGVILLNQGGNKPGTPNFGLQKKFTAVSGRKPTI